MEVKKKNGLKFYAYCSKTCSITSTNLLVSITFSSFLPLSSMAYLLYKLEH